MSSRVDIEIDLLDYIDQLSDEALLRELAERKQKPLQDIHADLVAGDVDRARRGIEAMLLREHDPRSQWNKAREGKHPFLTVRA
jgi:hypothetical protein